jgi:DNA-binding ferritin-like protein
MKVIASLTAAYEAANEANKIGLANFLQDRVDIHEKHGWMLRSFSKGK